MVISTPAAVVRPRVFISSTIRDFHDLRTAIRYFLEQAGYDVQLSEHNDFDREAAPDVFESCFANIRSSDFFILLVGREPGFWYNEKDRVSVTRQEFRVAREAESRGSFGICVFVPGTVDIAIKQWEQDGRPSAGSGYATDPEFTANFLAEVRAPPLGRSAPRWVYPFSDFRDIADALQVLLRIATNFERRLLEANLLQEILTNLTLMSRKGWGRSIDAGYAWATPARDQITVTADQLHSNIPLTSRQLSGLGFLYLAKPRSALRHQIMDEAIARGLFLSFDPNTGQVDDTVEHEALRKLREDIVDFETRRRSEFQTRADEEFLMWAKRANSGQLPDGAEVSADNLTIVLGLHDRLDDIYRALAEFAKWLVEASDTPTVDRRPVSPIEGMSEKIEAERVTVAELRWALSNRVFPFGPRLTQEDRELVREIEDTFVQGLRSEIPESVLSDDDLKATVQESLDKTVIEPYVPPPPAKRRARRP